MCSLFLRSEVCAIFVWSLTLTCLAGGSCLAQRRPEPIPGRNEPTWADLNGGWQPADTPVTNSEKAGGSPTVSVYELQHEVPRRARKEYEKGEKLLEKGQFTEAIQPLSKATELDPEYPAAQNDLAAAYLEQTKPDDAIPHLQAAITIDPHYVPAYSNLAVAYLQRNELPAAENAARRMMNLGRGSPRARWMLGYVLVAQNKFTDETTSLLSRVESQFPEAGLLLGRVLAARGDISGAKSKITRYLSTGLRWGREMGKQWLELLNQNPNNAGQRSQTH
jgi:Flp pilus assembly protein TadD